jgi:hypothetical protein
MNSLHIECANVGRMFKRTFWRDHMIKTMEFPARLGSKTVGEINVNIYKASVERRSTF